MSLGLRTGPRRSKRILIISGVWRPSSQTEDGWPDRLVRSPLDPNAERPHPPVLAGVPYRTETLMAGCIIHEYDEYGEDPDWWGDEYDSCRNASDCRDNQFCRDGTVRGHPVGCGALYVRRPVRLPGVTVSMGCAASPVMRTRTAEARAPVATTTIAPRILSPGRMEARSGGAQWPAVRRRRRLRRMQALASSLRRSLRRRAAGRTATAATATTASTPRATAAALRTRSARQVRRASRDCAVRRR